MKILVLNGSPKGENSITLQTVRYLEKLHPEQEFRVLNVGSKIKALEKDMTSALEELRQAELLLFSYPVYTFLAPSQLHRFIELLKEAGVELTGKFATQLTTSKHFYDITAHEYIRENCFDLGLKFIPGLSADMDDLTHKKGQKEATAWFEHLLWCVENNLYDSIPAKAEAFAPVSVTPAENGAGKQGDIVIVADLQQGDAALAAMIDRFRAVCPKQTRVVNIREFPFRGGCISCFHCAPKGECIYQDGFADFLRNEIQKAQAIVLAFTVSDHSMGARFKMYDDREFCNGHRTVTMGMPFGYLVNGAYSREKNLQTVLEARAQVGGNFLAGVATNEFDPDNEIDAMAKQLCYAVDTGYCPPSDFYGVGGMKIFRDLIWLMQGMMRADHRFYKAHKQYDFPQKQWPTMLAMYLVGGMIANPKLQKKLGSKMSEGMLMPYKKVLDAVDRENDTK